MDVILQGFSRDYMDVILQGRYIYIYIYLTGLYRVGFRDYMDAIFFAGVI